MLLAIIFCASRFKSQTPLINSEGTTINTRLIAPEGYILMVDSENSFAAFLGNFPLKKANSKVYLFDGNEKSRQDVHVAVLDIDVGKKDLQQCADAVMRLRAEYLYKIESYKKISFNFTNGFKAEYSKWIQGYRIKVKGNKCTWYLAAKPGNTREIFNAYLEKVFSFAGTLSLSKELKKKNLSDISVGDVFIKGGSPGHAVIVVDAAMHVKTQERVFCLAQSYMPAQNIHILKNPNNNSLSPWYTLKEGEVLETPEWNFEPGSLYTFE